MPCATLADQSAAMGISHLPLLFFIAWPPLMSTEIACCLPGVTSLVTSNTDGVNEVVFVPTSLPSTDSVAWKLTAPNSIRVVCAAPEEGTAICVA